MSERTLIKDAIVLSIDPDIGELIFDAEVTEIEYAAFDGQSRADHRKVDRPHTICFPFTA